jgi:hypothetical protein
VSLFGGGLGIAKNTKRGIKNAKIGRVKNENWFA